MESDAKCFALFCHLLCAEQPATGASCTLYLRASSPWPFVCSHSTVFHRSDFTLGIFSGFLAKHYLRWTFDASGATNWLSIHPTFFYDRWLDTQSSSPRFLSETFMVNFTFEIIVDVHWNELQLCEMRDKAEMGKWIASWAFLRRNNESVLAMAEHDDDAVPQRENFIYSHSPSSTHRNHEICSWHSNISKLQSVRMTRYYDNNWRLLRWWNYCKSFARAVRREFMRDAVSPLPRLAPLVPSGWRAAEGKSSSSSSVKPQTKS